MMKVLLKEFVTLAMIVVFFVGLTCVMYTLENNIKIKVADVLVGGSR